jgi:large subunit ribosomal protein L31e
MKLERVYTVPLGKAIEVARQKRTPRAVKILRAFIARHMKQEDERITLSAALNDQLWQRSIKKPPKRVKVRLIKDEGFIRAYLADEKIVEPKKKAEDKKEAPAQKPAAPKAAADGKAPGAPSPAPAATEQKSAPKSTAPLPAAQTGEKK